MWRWQQKNYARTRKIFWKTYAFFRFLTSIIIATKSSTTQATHSVETVENRNCSSGLADFVDFPRGMTAVADQFIKTSRPYFELYRYFFFYPLSIWSNTINEINFDQKSNVLSYRRHFNDCFIKTYVSIIFL